MCVVVDNVWIEGELCRQTMCRFAQKRIQSMVEPTPRCPHFQYLPNTECGNMFLARSQSLTGGTHFGICSVVFTSSTRVSPFAGAFIKLHYHTDLPLWTVWGFPCKMSLNFDKGPEICAVGRNPMYSLPTNRRRNLGCPLCSPSQLWPTQLWVATVPRSCRVQLG